MNFPISSQISPEQYGPKLTGTVLRIDGNAGQIPPSFQFAVLTAAPESEDDPPQQLCAQGISAMTADQWNAWTDQDSETYILECVAENESLTLVDPPAAPAPTSKKKTRR